MRGTDGCLKKREKIAEQKKEIKRTGLGMKKGRFGPDLSGGSGRSGGGVVPEKDGPIWEVLDEEYSSEKIGLLSPKR